MRRLGLAVACLAALAAAQGALAATTPSQPTHGGTGHTIQTPVAPPPRTPQLTQARATQDFLRYPKVAHWLSRYPKKGRVTEATYDAPSSTWTVKVWWGAAGEIAEGKVSDPGGTVTEAWTGPQVAWKMARGYPGAFGGTKINSLPVWLAFCAAFLLGLADWRRPLSVRNLDLLVLLSFSVSLWYFNRGDVFTSVPLAYPPLVYLVLRALWAVRRGPAKTGRPLWPVWVLAAGAVFLTGFRIGLNVRASNVIDVGYAGVIGADRISHGVVPYGHFPVEDSLKPCGPADASGEIRDRIQANGRCETANPLGDTYGPASYEAYLPGYWILGWTGKWDDLPAAHFTSILWDLVALAGLVLVGRRFGGSRLAATLAFAWAAYPFTQYVSSSNTNDAIMPAFLIWGFWLVTRGAPRGILLAFAGWTKFAAFIAAPMWLTYPDWRRPRRWLWSVAGLAAGTLATCSILLLDPHLLDSLRVFWDRTVWTQVTRHSPFSLWDWGQYHARGIPDLHLEQHVLEGLLVAGAIAAVFVPRRKTPFQLAALTAALLVGFELVLTHWFYLYIPWFFPFAAFTVLAPAGLRSERRRAEETDARGVTELVPAR